MARRRRSSKKHSGVPVWADVKRNPDFFRSCVTEAATERGPYEDLWLDCLNIYLAGTTIGEGNDVSVSRYADEDRIIANLLKDSVDGIKSTTLMSNPKFKLSPATANDREPATVAERYINEVWERYRMHPQFKKACVDSLITSVGWLKVMWRQVTEDVTPDEERVYAAAEQLAQDVLDFRLARPDLADQLPDPRDVARSAVEQADEEAGRAERRTVLNHPLLMRVSPFDVYVDPTASDIEGVRWICQRVVRNVSEVQADKSYSRKNRALVRPSKIEAPGERGTANVGSRLRREHSTTSQNRQTTVWEMWSMEFDCYAVWCDGLSDGWLIAPGEPPMDRHPFIYIPLFEVPERFYPAGFVQQGIRIQEALSDGLTTMRIHRDNSIRQWLVRKEHSTPEFRESLRRADIDGVVEVPNVNQQTPLKDVIVEAPQGKLNADWYQFDQMLQRYLSSVTSQDDFLEEAPSTRRSATEASIANDRHSARAADINDTFEKAANEAARRIMSLAQNWLFEDEPFGEITSGRVDTGGLSAANRENIASEREFRFDVEVGSMAPRDDAVHRHEATLMFNTLLEALAAGVPVEMGEATRRYLRAHGVTDPERLVPDQQTPETGPAGAGAGELSLVQGSRAV